jgi:hypothetical protein
MIVLYHQDTAGIFLVQILLYHVTVCWNWSSSYFLLANCEMRGLDSTLEVFMPNPRTQSFCGSGDEASRRDGALALA